MLNGKAHLDRLILEMTTDEIDEAERQVLEFRPRSFKEAFPEVIRAHLNLQGIIGAKGKQLALLNGKSLEQGESIEINVGSFPVRVRCDLIDKRNVRISFDGGTALLMVE